MFQMMALVTKVMHLVFISLFVFMGFYLYLVKPKSSVCRDVYAYQMVILIMFTRKGLAWPIRIAGAGLIVNALCGALGVAGPKETDG